MYSMIGMYGHPTVTNNPLLRPRVDYNNSKLLMRFRIRYMKCTGSTGGILCCHTSTRYLLSAVDDFYSSDKMYRLNILVYHKCL